MSVAGNDLAAAKRLPEVVADTLVGDVLPDLLRHGELPAENFLVRESVKRPGQTQKGGGIGEERVGECGPDEICEKHVKWGNQRRDNRSIEDDLRAVWAETFPPS